MPYIIAKFRALEPCPRSAYDHHHAERVHRDLCRGFGSKDFLAGNFRLSLEKVTTRLFLYGQTLLAFGRIVEPREQVDMMRAVTADDILSVARAVFRPSNRALSRVVPVAARGQK